MKKFLTVLLALSVVFTYTVGTAFATVSTPDVKTAVNAKISEELKLVEAAKIVALNGIKANAAEGIKAVDGTTKFVQIVEAGANVYFTTTDIDLIAEKVVADATRTLEAQGEEVLKAGTYENNTALTNALASINANGFKELSDFDAKVKTYEKLADLSLEYAKDRYDAFVKAVELDAYSDEKDATTGVSNRDLVEAAQEKAIDLIADAKVGYAVTGSAQQIAVDFLDEIKDIPTIVEDSYEAADLAAVKELAISAMTSAYTTEKAAKIAEQNTIIRDKDSTAAEVAAAKEAIEEIEATYNAAMGLLKDQINGLTSLKDLNVYGANGDKWVIGTYANGRFTPSVYLTNADMKYMALAVEKADKIADLNDKAVLAKQFIGIEGSKYFSEEEVDSALEAAIEKVYPAKTSKDIKDIVLDAMTPAEALAAKIKALIGAADKTVVVNKTAYPTVKDWADDATKNYTYDSDVADAVADLAEATEEALKEATTIADAEKIFLDAYAEFDAYVTDAEHAKLYRKGGALYEDFTSYEKQIVAAVEAKEIVTAGNDDYSFNTSTPGKFAANLIAEMRKANTKADLDAKFAEAKEIVANVKTVSAIKAEAKALNDRALAIKDAASADKAEVVAILDGYAEIEKYIETIDMANVKAPVLYKNLVTSYLQAIADAEAKAINDAIKAVGKVTVEDKEAVEKIVADAEALEKLMADYGLTATNPTIGDVDALAAALAKAEVNKVVEMIMDLDTVVTADNIDDVKAAKAAYDALNADQKASINNIVYDKLVAVLKLAEKFEINAVKSLKVVKNHSVAGKGYIKIAWSTIGDDSVVDGYRVYRSTKKDTGYGTKPIFTTTGKTYKNTKDLKKGTRYYYKVRAYKVVDGKTYFSAYSNKAHRVAK